MPKNGRIIEKKMADEEIETNSNESRMQSSFGGGIVNSTSETENRSVIRPITMQLDLKYNYGARGCKRGAVHYIDLKTVAYAVGEQLAIHNIAAQTITYIKRDRDAKAISTINVSPSKKYMAISEIIQSSFSAPKHRISVYSIETLALIRIMALDSPNAHSSLSFSFDDKYLVSVGGTEALTQVVYWLWSKEKPVASTMIPEKVNRVHFNPNDSSHATVSGPNCFKQIKLNPDFTLKVTNLINIGNEQVIIIVDHSWVVEDYIIALAENGRVWIIERINGITEIRQTKNLKLMGEHVHCETIVGYSKGFIIGGSNGIFQIYEKSGDVKDPFMHIRSFSVGEKEIVSSISISPQSASAAVFLSSSQVTTFPLGQYDVIPEGETGFQHIVDSGVHTGAITAMKSCLQRPIVVTASIDHTVKVWNYLTWKCEVFMNMQDEPTALSIHPNGFQVVIGFKEKVRIYNILVDSIKHFQDLGLKNCKQLEYSHGGQYIAAAVGINVLIYKTFQLTCIATFTGHIQPSSQLVWSENDTRVFSCGIDGGIYGWDIHSRSRVEDACCVVKSCRYTGVDHVMDEDNECIIAVGSDNKMRVINHSGDFIPYEMDPHTLTRVVVSRCKKFLFAGTNNGCIRVFNWPVGAANYIEYPVHESHASVNHLIIAGNKYLFSSGSDGTLFVLMMNDEGEVEKTDKVDTTLYNMDSIMVAREDYEEKLNIIAEDKKKMEEDRSNSSYELNSERVVWAEKLKALQISAAEQVEAERVRFESTQSDHEKKEKDSLEEQEKRDKEHNQLTKEMENQFEHKLAIEMERYDQMCEESEVIRQQLEKALDTVHVQHEAVLAKMKHTHNMDIANLNIKIKQLNQDLRLNADKFEEVLAQQEGEYEKELSEMKDKSNAELNKEHTSIAMKEGTIGRQRSLMDGMKKRMEKLEDKEKEQLDAYAALELKYNTLQETLKHFEKHLDDRETALTDKEQTILSLLNHNRTLDNFRFVLDNRISQMSDDQGPILDHVNKLEKHITKMYEELVAELEKKKENARSLSQKDAKIEIFNGEIAKLRHKNKDLETTIASFARDLENAVKFSTQAGDWEDVVKKLYKSYCKNEGPVKSNNSAVNNKRDNKNNGKPGASIKLDSKLGGVQMDQTDNIDRVLQEEVRNLAESKTVITELLYQRDHNVQSNQILKRSLKIAEEKLGNKSKQSMGENSMLINECNNLRRNNKIYQNKIEELNEAIKSLQRSSKSRNNNLLQLAQKSEDTDSRFDASDIRSENPESPMSSIILNSNNQALPPVTKLKKSASANAIPKSSGLLPSGKLVRGSTLNDQMLSRQKMASLLSLLDETQRENVSLKSQIKGLRLDASSASVIINNNQLT